MGKKIRKSQQVVQRSWEGIKSNELSKGLSRASPPATET